MQVKKIVNCSSGRLRRAILLCVAVMLFSGLQSGKCATPETARKLEAKITSLHGAEVYLIETDKGEFEMSDFHNIIYIEPERYVQLSDAILKLNGKTVLLHLDHDIVVGVSEPQSGLKVTPPYRLKQKMKYKGVETKLETTLGYWTEDEFLLVIHTPEGWYCVDSNYEYVDYYDKVVAKLRAQVAREARVYRPISLSVYNLSSVNDCLGYVADIEFLPVKAGGKAKGGR